MEQTDSSADMVGQSVPEGYRRDGQGRLIPESLIKPIDLQRDQLVRELVGGALHARDVLLAFKRQAFQDIEAHVQLSIDEYGVSEAVARATSRCFPSTAGTR